VCIRFFVAGFYKGVYFVGMRVSFIFCLITALVVLSVPFSALALISGRALSGGVLPFGGFVTSITYCNQGVLETIRPAGSSPSTIMWLYPSPLYLYNMSAPPHVGQWQLGLLGGIASCYVGKIYRGSGPTIKFYGSSK